MPLLTVHRARSSHSKRMKGGTTGWGLLVVVGRRGGVSAGAFHTCQSGKDLPSFVVSSFLLLILILIPHDYYFYFPFTLFFPFLVAYFSSPPPAIRTLSLLSFSSLYGSPSSPIRKSSTCFFRLCVLSEVPGLSPLNQPMGKTLIGILPSKSLLKLSILFEIIIYYPQIENQGIKIAKKR